MNTSQVIALGFAGVIFVGGIILWLPFCTVPGETTSFTDAVFTAATCVCVTGLTTVVTATHWTIIGKCVILFLIQIGGIGVITITILIFVGMKRRISMRNRRMIQEAYNLEQMSGLVKLVLRIVRSVLGAELVGAVLYSFCFVPEFGWAEGLAQAVFTAVSAFCNAGIDILGENSLASYVNNPLVNFTTMGLIIAAGLGFGVWWDIAGNLKKIIRGEMPLRRFYRSLRLHSKIVIDMTLILVVGGTVLLFLFEQGNPATMKELPLGSKVMAAAFQSVTTRTAGFFTIDQAGLTGPSVILCLFLMFVGGSPMGTAGGIKTTTFAVMVLAVWASIRGFGDIEAHHRKIRESAVRSAVVVTTLGFLTLLTGCLVMGLLVPEAELSYILYEMTSAIGTVGLTRGLTPTLPVTAKWLVILTMYLGRIGPFTLGTAVSIRLHKRQTKIHLAQGDIMIG